MESTRDRNTAKAMAMAERVPMTPNFKGPAEFSVVELVLVAVPMVTV